jgi:S-adenosylmethionine decarboxylase
MTKQQIIKNTYSPGKHVLLDFWGVKEAMNLKFIESAFREVADICNANILDIRLHSFGENSGITGVAILEESHMSIHTWPEIDFCAIDVFMCGKCDASNAIEPLKKIFNPHKFELKEYSRGSII